MFDVDINYFILIFNFGIRHLMLIFIMQFDFVILWYAMWNCGVEVFITPSNTICDASFGCANDQFWH